VNFDSITLCVVSQRVFIIIVVHIFMTRSGNFWIHPRMEIASKGITCRYNNLVNKVLFNHSSCYLIATPLIFKEIQRTVYDE
jgi:hypothetical protein